MNLIFRQIKSFAVMAVIMVAAACTNGPAPDNEAVEILAKSVVDGEYIADSTRTLYITYSHHVIIADSFGITLNNARIVGAATDNATLILPVDLEPDHDYRMTITEGAVISNPGSQPAPGVNVDFHTNPLPL